VFFCQCGESDAKELLLHLVLRLAGIDPGCRVRVPVQYQSQGLVQQDGLRNFRFFVGDHRLRVLRFFAGSIVIVDGWGI
jgi:hypothetical protein